MSLTHSLIYSFFVLLASSLYGDFCQNDRQFTVCPFRDKPRGVASSDLWIFRLQIIKHVDAEIFDSRVKVLSRRMPVIAQNLPRSQVRWLHHG